jgi:hypothetical protein
MDNIDPLWGFSDTHLAAMLRELLRRNDCGAFTLLSENNTTLTSRELVASLRATLPVMPSHSLAHQQPSRPGPIVVGLRERPSYFSADFPSLSELAQSYLEQRPVLAESRIAKTGIWLMAGRLPLMTVRRPFPREMPALQLCMKPPAQCYGWEAKMKRLGYRVSTKPDGHCQQQHLIRKDDESFSVLQGCTKALLYSVGPLSMFDYQVVLDLKKVGVLVSTVRPQKATPDTALAEAP